MPEDKSLFSHLVVVGASAGGIEALSTLFLNLPEDFPAPVVVAQHLDPERESHLQEILSRRSKLPVKTVTDHAPLEAGVIFVVPSNWHVNITDSEIGLQTDSGGRPMPSIDRLMRSAAGAYGENLVAVILSGTGTDGTEGARAVRQAGGTVVIQDPDTAQFGGMPGSLAPNTVDMVVGLDRIGPMLGELLSGAEVTQGRTEAETRRALERFLEELRERHGVDFTSYKTPTLMRRLQRRLVATGTRSIDDYAGYLWDHPEEYRQLVNSFLIKVTEFFRDPDLFDHLRDEILPRLIQEARESGHQLRIWSAGCATGEEAYALAIMLTELLGNEAGTFNARIFATDVDDEAVTFARHGLYPPSALSSLSEEQIERYFDRQGSQYQVTKAVRGMIVFGEHDLARRSPFPRIDLVVSRNVLIYFTDVLQRRALQLFAYSLRDGGYLVLGKAETTSPLSQFFDQQDRTHKVYRRVGERFLMPPPPHVSPAPPSTRPERGVRSASVGDSLVPGGARDLRRTRIVEDGILNQLPVGVVLVNRRYDITSVNMAARRLLSIHGAAIGEDLLHLLRDVPYADVRNTIDAAFRDSDDVVTREFAVEDATTGEVRHLQLVSRPMRAEDERGPTQTVAILAYDVTETTRARSEIEERFEAARAELERFRGETGAAETRAREQNERLVEENRRLESANRELTDLNQDLQIAHEEALIGAEEAQAATEEVETLNEELQATNEELETLNEELQATIEELNTTNDDLQARSAELQDLARKGEGEQRQLRAILESIPDAVLVVEGAGRAVLANAAYRELFGEDGAPTALDASGNPLPPDETPLARTARGEAFFADFAAAGEDGTRGRFRAEGRPIGVENGGGVLVIREL